MQKKRKKNRGFVRDSLVCRKTPSFRGALRGADTHVTNFYLSVVCVIDINCQMMKNCVGSVEKNIPTATTSLRLTVLALFRQERQERILGVVKALWCVDLTCEPAPGRFCQPEGFLVYLRRV